MTLKAIHIISVSTGTLTDIAGVITVMLCQNIEMKIVILNSTVKICHISGIFSILFSNLFNVVLSVMLIPESVNY